MIMAKNFEFDKPMKDGLDLFKENMGLLIGASLVASLLSVFTLLIISGPMTVGILLVVRQCLKDKQNKPQIGDLFKGFSSFFKLLSVYPDLCRSFLNPGNDSCYRAINQLLSLRLLLVGHDVYRF